MRKEIIRKEFFKLKIKGHSYNQCREILIAKYNYETSIRTLQRWMSRFEKDGSWDLQDFSKRPKTIHRRITSDMKSEVIRLRKQTAWGQEKIANLVHLSHWSINKILKKNN